MKAVSAPGVRAAAKNAKEAGETRFTWSCSLHGEQLFYSSSAACPRCTVERKDKLHQREYNRRVAKTYPHVKDPKTGRYTRKKVSTIEVTVNLKTVTFYPGEATKTAFERGAELMFNLYSDSQSLYIGLSGVEDTPPGVLIGRVKSKG